MSSYRDRIDAAERYIASEKSDPFVRDRVYSHMARFNSHSNTPSVCGFIPNGQDAFYSAEEAQEERSYTVNGVKHIYHATVYRNVQRP